MTPRKTYELIAMHTSCCNGYNQNACNMALGKNIQDFRESDLKSQLGTMFNCALKS